MRRLLGVLREDTGEPAAERQPQPGLRQLTELLDEARDASGTGARLIISGPAVTLDPGVELAAYRIIQEALTNARRHAPGAAVDVELQYADDSLGLRIRDNGPGPAARPAVLPAGQPAVPPAVTGPVTACSACANGPRPSAVSCAPARRPAAASWSRPACPARRRRPHERRDPRKRGVLRERRLPRGPRGGRHPDRGRRRSSGGPDRIRRTARHAARLHGSRAPRATGPKRCGSPVRCARMSC